jgi:hypothetical protein
MLLHTNSDSDSNASYLLPDDCELTSPIDLSDHSIFCNFNFTLASFYFIYKVCIHLIMGTIWLQVYVEEKNKLDCEGCFVILLWFISYPIYFHLHIKHMIKYMIIMSISYSVIIQLCIISCLYHIQTIKQTLKISIDI